jgi:hypothetical protein
MGSVIMSTEPRRKDASAKSLTSTDVNNAEKGLKGNRGEARAIFFRKLGFFALIAYFIGGVIVFVDSRGYISVPFVKHVERQLNEKLNGSKMVDSSEQQTGKKVVSLETKELAETSAKVAPAAKQAEAKAKPQFCGECKWHKGISCHRRQRYLINKYGLSEEKSLANMLNEPQCQKSVARRLRAGKQLGV